MISIKKYIYIYVGCFTHYYKGQEGTTRMKGLGNLTCKLRQRRYSLNTKCQDLLNIGSYRDFYRKSVYIHHVEFS